MGNGFVRNTELIAGQMKKDRRTQGGGWGAGGAVGRPRALQFVGSAAQGMGGKPQCAQHRVTPEPKKENIRNK